MIRTFAATLVLAVVPTLGYALDANDMPFRPVPSAGPIKVVSKNLHPDAMIVSAMWNNSPSGAMLNLTVENVAFIAVRIEVGCLVFAGDEPIYEMSGIAANVPDGTSGILGGEVPSNATGAACRVLSVEPE